MKKGALLVILLFFLFIPFSFAQDWVYTSSDLVMGINISSELEITPLSQNYFIKQVNVDLEFFPKEGALADVLSLATIPDVTRTEDSLLFAWNSPSANKLGFLVDSKVKVKSGPVKVAKKVPFPVKDLPAGMEIYTRPTENIESDNEKIMMLASDLAQGEDDLYVVTNKLAWWVEKNIEYSLTTLTATASQPASWVFENKYGVCDEISSLFIAMVRSLGIPARYVSGVAYTDFQELNDWGPHAWAEVYFPGYGWVPFDITYREFGFVDPTHIALKYSLDSGESSTKYEWIGSNVDIKTEKLDIKTKLESQGSKISPPVSLDVNVLKNSVGFGSYNLVEASVQNLEDYYVTASLFMAKVNELDVINDDVQYVLLKPGQKKSIYFVIKLKEGLSRGYIYTIPVEVYTYGEVYAKAEFKSTEDRTVYSKSEIEKVLEQRIEEEEKIYSKEISLECKTDKGVYYPKENALISCYIKNSGNVILEGLNVCLKEQCKKIDLGISQEKAVDFEEEITGLETAELEISAKNSQVSKTIYLKINVLDTPEIDIKEIIAPDEVSYGDSFTVKFTLKKESKAVPKNVEIKLKRLGLPRAWEIKELARDEEFVIEMKGSDLGIGKNDFSIIVRYNDDLGKNYEIDDKFTIRLREPTFSQKTAIFFKDSFRKIFGIFQ